LSFFFFFFFFFFFSSSSSFFFFFFFLPLSLLLLLFPLLLLLRHCEPAVVDVLFSSVEERLPLQHSSRYGKPSEISLTLLSTACDLCRCCSIYSIASSQLWVYLSACALSRSSSLESLAATHIGSASFKTRGLMSLAALASLLLIVGPWVGLLLLRLCLRIQRVRCESMCVCRSTSTHLASRLDETHVFSGTGCASFLLLLLVLVGLEAVVLASALSIPRHSKRMLMRSAQAVAIESTIPWSRLSLIVQSLQW